MWQRQPGQGRYAKPERERRFLLSAQPGKLNDPRHIVDRYIDGTRLRLRQITGAGPSVYKLGQKVRPNEEDPSVVMLTNMYLTANEYQCLLSLPFAEVRKTRYSLQAGPDLYAIDVFEERLEGLVLAEGELGEEDLQDLQDLHELPPLAGLVAEVTTDDHFSGATLARTTKDELGILLSSFGLT